VNIIEQIRNILQSFPKIGEVCGGIHIDFSDPNPTSYGLSSLGDKLVSEDILGGQKRQHSFMLYSTFSGINDYERLGNSGAVLELGNWLSRQIGGEVDTEIDGEIYHGEITKITAENGMLYAVPQENTQDGIRYQLQIIAEYTAEE
jgi:hypothetical protein